LIAVVVTGCIVVFALNISNKTMVNVAT